MLYLYPRTCTVCEDFLDLEYDPLNNIYNSTHSALISGLAPKSLFCFCAALVQPYNQIATRIVLNRVISAEKAPKAETNLAYVAKCVAHVVKSERSVTAGIFAQYGKHLKVNTLTLTCRSLLTPPTFCRREQKPNHHSFSFC